MKQIALLVVVLSLSVVAESLGGRLSTEELSSLPYSQSLNFDFGPGKVAPGYTQVLQTTTYSKELGYGFEPGADVTCVDRGGRDALRSDLCTSDQPFFFSVALPEGNHEVTITFGDQSAETVTTVKAELRRLMLEEVRTAAGKFTTRSFTVN